MLAGDSRGAWDWHVLDDPRVVSLWDGSRLTGKWFADHSLGRLGGPGSIVWDAYFAFGANARWRSEPSGLLAAGATSSTTPAVKGHRKVRQFRASKSAPLGGVVC